MANIKISGLEETKINNPDESFVMVVAKDDASNLYKNFRISLTELRNIIGSIEGDIVAGVTEQDVIDIVNNAISADNLNELTTGTVSGMIAQAIADIPKVEPGLSESYIQGMIDTSISTDNRNELTTVTVSGMIAQAIADNLKDTVTEVVPDVIPEVLPEVLPEVIPNILPETTIEVTSDSLETPTAVKVVEVAEKAIINEIEITKIKETTEDCVCDEHADGYFTEIFK